MNFLLTGLARPPANAEKFEAESLAGLRSICFVDLETTGFGNADRIVSFGGVKLMLEKPGELRCLHLVFNPERKCS